MLAQGEIGFETDTKKIKIGDGTTYWNTLAYWSDGGGSEGITVSTASLPAGVCGLITGINVSNVAHETIIVSAASPGMASNLTNITLGMSGSVKTFVVASADVVFINYAAPTTTGTLLLNSPTGVNLPAAAGDVIAFVNIGGNGSLSGYWRELYRTLHV